ncbi:MAG: hypothetical protein H7039_12485, partial [Bryobacteraceae bacterium]|nr:hypothetical protein [Bryobacteraceae bacterium]
DPTILTVHQGDIVYWESKDNHDYTLTGFKDLLSNSSGKPVKEVQVPAHEGSGDYTIVGQRGKYTYEVTSKGCKRTSDTPPEILVGNGTD